MKLLVADDERWIRKGIIKMVTVEKFGFEEILEAGTLKEYVFQMGAVVNSARSFIRNSLSQSLSCSLDMMIFNM